MMVVILTPVDGIIRWLPRGFSCSPFSDEQIICILREAEAGVSARELCRKHAISDATFYTWRKKYGGMEVPEVKRLKSLEEENARLKKLLAEAMLDKEALQVALGRKY